MSRSVKKKQTFSTLGEFLKFVEINKLKVEKEVGTSIETNIWFTDGSSATTSYVDGWCSDAGTWWDAEFTISYWKK